MSASVLPSKAASEQAASTAHSERSETAAWWLLVGYIAVVTVVSLLWFWETIPAEDYSLVLGTMATGMVTGITITTKEKDEGGRMKDELVPRRQPAWKR